MAGLIKKQILKHLSKFAKNLSADKINLSTFRGEGELSNLELDCVALQNVMNLPTWLQINHATCNKVHVKIPWTKLTTTPISIFLDAVEVDMITCEKPREPNGPSPIQASASSGDTSYGFTEKVLEGMAVSINSISVKFTSAAFNATFQLSQLLVLSTNPKWESTDLKDSRIQDKTLGQVLTFKKLSWQTMRIVANAVTSGDKSMITPLRLITNHSEIRMTFRRKIADCSILASRLHIYFDDLLWVLTDSQVQSALLCVKSLRDTIERSSQQMRELGLEKSQEASQQPAQPSDVTNDGKNCSHTSKLFLNHTVIETSLHLDFDRVDLHICEESSPLHKASTQAGMQGGAIQISLQSLKIDHYPYHKPASDRHHFRDYGETMAERDIWSQGIIKQFRRDFAVLSKATGAAGNLKTTSEKKKHSRLVENCLIVRLADIDIHQVTTSNGKKLSTGRLINSTRKELHLPDEMPLFHFIRTEYFYPDGRDFPAPHDNIFMQINAPQIHAHWDSLIWLNRLSTVTAQAVQAMLEDLGILLDSGDVDDPAGDAPPVATSTTAKEEEHTDIRIQVLMPKIFVPGHPSTHMEQPHGIEIQASKAAVTNCREGMDCSRMHLKNVLNKIEKQRLAKDATAFPNESNVDLSHSQEIFRSYAKGNDSPLNVTLRSENPTLTRNALIGPASKDIWSVDLENIWIDFVMPSKKKLDTQPTEGGFLGVSTRASDPVLSGARTPFIDSFPAQLWIGKAFGSGTAKLETAVQSLSPVLSPTSSVLHVNSPTMEDTPLFQQPKTDTNCPEVVSRDTTSSPPLKLSASRSSPDLNERRTSSPRSMRNKKLLDYYCRPSPSEESLPKDQDAAALDQASVASSSSVKNKVIATYIMLQTDKSLRLQLDHHQYLYLLHFIDMLEEVDKQLDDSSLEDSSSLASSASSTPSHSSKLQRDISRRPSRKKSKPINTTSVRISAPSADLFLTLRPPPNVRAKESSACKSDVAGSDVQETDSVVKGIEPSAERDIPSDMLAANGSSKVAAEKAPMKFSPAVQDTPPLSECSSDTTSMQDSDSLSMFGDSFASHGGACAHAELGAVENLPHLNTHPPSLSHPLEVSENGDVLVLQKQTPVSALTGPESPAEVPVVKENSPLSKEKSDSFLILPVAGTVASNDGDKTRTHDHSLDNLAVATSACGQRQLGIVNVTTSKTSSSGYDSGSYESIPPPCPAVTEGRTHSRSSSDASDQFCMIQVDEKGKGMEDYSSVKLVRNLKTPSISSGHISETSSLSSQSLPTSEQRELSTSDLAEDLPTVCGMVDSQITMTNVETASWSSTSDKESQTPPKSSDKDPGPELSSQALLHISNGVELAVDSNDAGDAVVKIVAAAVDVFELGMRDNQERNLLFADYSMKKCESLLKERGDSRSRSSTPDVCLRIDSGPLAGRFSPMAVKEGNIQLSANGVHLGLKSSTLANLGAFLEDDTIPAVVPMQIEATDVKLTIEDDMPPAYEATPQPDPITLHVHSATVKRTDDGTFHVITSSSSGEKVTLPDKTHDLPPQASAKPNDVAIVYTPDVRNGRNVATAGATPENFSVGNTDDASSEKDAAGNRNENNSKPEGHEEKASRMQQVIDDLKQKLREVETERDCLSEALKLMQEDLILSERERGNLQARIDNS